MIHINLLTHQVTKRVPSRGKELGVAGGVFAASLVAIATAHSLQTLQLNEVSATVDGLEKQVVTLRKQNQLLTELNIRRKDLEGKIRTIGVLVDRPRRVAPIRVLDELSMRTPEGLWLTEYREQKGFAQIRGKSIDNQTIASFAYNLSASPYLRSVEIRETQQDMAVNVPQDGKSGAIERGSVAPPAMTQFLIEAAINYEGASEDGGKQESRDFQQQQSGKESSPLTEKGSFETRGEGE